MNIEVFTTHLFETPSYKHVNSFLIGLISDLSVAPYVESWINNEDVLNSLGGFEYVYNADFNYVEHENLKRIVQQGNQITVDQWQSKTKGKSILVANGEYFANESVAISLCLHYGNDEVRNAIMKVIDERYDQEYEYAKFYNVYTKFSTFSPLTQKLLVHDLANYDDCWYKFFYSGNEHVNALTRLADFIMKRIG